jgi:hypothetical protein
MRLSLAVCAVHKVATQKNLGIMGPQVVQAHVAGKRKKGAKKVRGPATHLMSDEQFYTYQSSIVVCCTQHTDTAQCVYVDTGTDTLGITFCYEGAHKGQKGPTNKVLHTSHSTWHVNRCAGSTGQKVHTNQRYSSSSKHINDDDDNKYRSGISCLQIGFCLHTVVVSRFVFSIPQVVYSV